MKHKSLIFIVVAFVALALLYSLVIPIGEGPDEPGHANYVFFLARASRLPDQRKNEVPGEGHQPPLAYALAAPLVAWLPPDQRQFDLPANPRFTWAAPSRDSGPVRELNAVAHGSREYWPWGGVVLAWHLARLVSVALGAATVIFTFLAARALNCKLQIADCRLSDLQSAIPWLAAALVAFNPQFLFVSALITNDALLTALSAALLWLALRRPTTDNRQLTTKATVLRAIAMGIVLGLALISKQSSIILVPVALLGVLERTGPFIPWLRRSATSLFSMLLVALAIGGWWYVRNLRLYGDLFGLAVFQAEFTTQAFDPRSPAAWLGALAQLHSSFWAYFGWVNVPAPGLAIWLFVGVELAAVIGWARHLGDGRKTEAERTRFRPPSAVLRLARLWPILGLPLLAFAWVLSFALTAGLVAWQGRLLFPALPAIGIVLAQGLAAWENREPRTENQAIAKGLRFLVLGSWFLVALWLPFGVIRPAYPFHALPEALARERIGAPVYGRLGLVGDPGAELLSWQVSGATSPGGAPAITLIWHALGRQNRNWTVFIHLVDANEQIVAEDNTQPQAGAFPMKQWVAGDWVEDRHTLALPAGLAPGTYTLRVGLYDPRTGRRAAVYDRAGKLSGDLVEVGQLTVR